MPKLLDYIKNMGGVFNHISLFNVSFFKGVKEQIEMILKNCTGDDLIDYKIYGNSIQKTTIGKNFLSNQNTNQRLSGVDFILNPDKSITVVGTATQDVYYYMIGNSANRPLGLNADTYALTSGSNDNNVWLRLTDGTNVYDSIQNPTTFSISEDKNFNAFIRVKNGATVNTTLYPQLEQGSTATPYEPYTNGASPNPDYPQEIKSVGDLVESGEHQGKYKIPVKISGKNKWKKISTQTKNGVTLTQNDDGTVTLNGTASATTSFELNVPVLEDELKIGETYTLSIDKLVSGVNLWIQSIKQNTSWIGNYVNIQGSGTEKSKTFVVGEVENAYYRKYQIQVMNGTIVNETFKIQLEEGSTATEYESYHEPISVPIYLDAPLRRARDGSIADVLDFGRLKCIRNIGKYIPPQDLTWYLFNISDTQRQFYFDLANVKHISTEALVSSNYFRAGNVYARAENGNNYTTYTTTRGLAVRDDDFADVNSFKTWLSTHDLVFHYIFQTPIEEDIELPDIPTFEGTTIIEVETETQPSNMWVKYYSN